MIKVTFKNDRRIEYTRQILPLLVTDPEVEVIEDIETGELLFINK